MEPMPNNSIGKASASKVHHPLINGKSFLPCLLHHLHLFINILGQPCDEQGNYLLPNAPPPQPWHGPAADDWTPYRNRVEFETAESLYRRTQMSASNIDTLLDLWVSTLLNHDDKPHLLIIPICTTPLTRHP
jgi:hypothetical protein